MDFIRGMLDRIVLVTGCVLAGCVPSFISQYRQRLGGQLDQVLADISAFQQIADKYHQGSLQELIQHHLNSNDATFFEEGTAVQKMLSTAEQLRQAAHALNADLYHQVAYLLTGGLDQNIAKAAWITYTPSFVLSNEGIIFSLVAGILIWLVFLLFWRITGAFINLITGRYATATL